MKYFVIICLFMFIGCEPVEPTKPPVNVEINIRRPCCPGGCPDKVSSRYHYWGRTRNFFGRVC